MLRDNPIHLQSKPLLPLRKPVSYGVPHRFAGDPKKPAPPATAKPKGRWKGWVMKGLVGLGLAAGGWHVSKPYVIPSTVEQRADRFLDSWNVNVHYYRPDSFGRYQKVSADEKLTADSKKVAQHITKVLWNRPDLLNLLESNGVDLHLYDGPYLKAEGNGVVLGEATTEGRKEGWGEWAFRKVLGTSQSTHYKGRINFATGAVDRGLADKHDGEDVVSHEFMHLFDAVDSHGRFDPKAMDGRLGDWSNPWVPGFVEKLMPWSARNRFEKALNDELALMKDSTKESIIRKYALREYEGGNKGELLEFVPVLTETYWERGADLKKENPELFNLMKQFFNRDSTDLTGDDAIDFPAKREPLPWMILAPTFAVIGVGGTVNLVRFIKKKRKPE